MYESDEPCTACGTLSVDRCYHHLHSRKAYPELKGFYWNKIPVCQKHHNEFHNKGTSHMSKRYPSVEFWLIRNGWEFDAFLNKWIHY